MQLVDEGDDFAVGLLDLVQHSLQSLLEFAAVFRAGDHGAQVQADELLAAQGLGHIASDDAAGQTFDDCGLTDARLANENRVILRATGEHLDDSSDLLVASDHWVDLAFAGTRSQVGGVLLQRLELAFRLLGGDLSVAADGFESAADGLKGGACLVHHLGRVGTALGDAGQQHLGGNVGIA